MENGAVIPPWRVLGTGGGVPASQLKSERDVICRVSHMFSSGREPHGLAPDKGERWQTALVCSAWGLNSLSLIK